MDYQIVLQQLRGYYPAIISQDVVDFWQACGVEANATYQDLLRTDNPFYYLMIVLRTRGLTSVQIAMALCEIGAIDYRQD